MTKLDGEVTHETQYTMVTKAGPTIGSNYEMGVSSTNAISFPLIFRHCMGRAEFGTRWFALLTS